jgi:regulator of cell morphogenesis and NO signaling
MKSELLQKTIAQIVRDNYRTADVFKRQGINFCCGGIVSLEEACLQKGLDVSAVTEELEEASQTVRLANNLQYNNWSIGFLIDYIINVHHAYLKEALPSIGAGLSAFAMSHKKGQPHLQTVLSSFERLSQQILSHTRQEEEVIFPYIRQVENTHRGKETYGSLFVKTLRKPLSNIGDEHKKMSQLLIEMRELTDHYVFPQNACTNHRVLFQKLQELDNDLMQHKHLENNILFPKAIELEAELLAL